MKRVFFEGDQREGGLRKEGFPTVFCLIWFWEVSRISCWLEYVLLIIGQFGIFESSLLWCVSSGN